MNKILTAGAALLIGALPASAAYTASQKAFINQINTHLEEKGYKPERVDDGLTFTADDRTYYIEVEEEATEPFFVRVCDYIPFSSGISRERVVEQLNELNQEHLQKTIAKDNNVVVISEMWAADAKEFISAFPYLLQSVQYNATPFH